MPTVVDATFPFPALFPPLFQGTTLITMATMTTMTMPTMTTITTITSRGACRVAHISTATTTTTTTTTAAAVTNRVGGSGGHQPCRIACFAPPPSRLVAQRKVLGLCGPGAITARRLALCTPSLGRGAVRPTRRVRVTATTTTTTAIDSDIIVVVGSVVTPWRSTHANANACQQVLGIVPRHTHLGRRRGR